MEFTQEEKEFLKHFLNNTQFPSYTYGQIVEAHRMIDGILQKLDEAPKEEKEEETSF